MPAEQKPDYSPGLEGVIAGETAICWVDPNAGLLYRGYDIHDLAQRASFEQIAWLLLRGELPTRAELADFRRRLAGERELPGPVVEALRRFPPETHPMDMLRTGVSMLAAFDPELNDHSHAANLRKAGRLIARVSTLVTAGWRIAHGLELLPAKPDLTHAANFLYSLTGEPPEAWRCDVFDTILALYADHEFNASTFAARVTASTMADIYSAVTSGLAALKGPLHGGANEETMKVLRAIQSPDDAEAWVAGKLSRKEKVMGFGHRVYKKGDSRVPMMRELARQLGRRFGQEQWVPVCERLEAVMEREKKLCANVDLYAAPVFHLLGFPPELNTPVFACSRISGWCAHVIEQHDHNRLIRPRSLYVGPARRAYVPDNSRESGDARNS
jgi:2-methylcitrate synthase/citrate synthase II